MFKIISLVAFGAAALAAPRAESPESPVLVVPIDSAETSPASPNPTQVTINSIAYGGTGCSQGSVGSFISADRSTFTLIFDQMVASIGTGVSITENRKNCQLNINLQYPPGFQYSILSTEFRGYAGLSANVTGVQSATYYFSGSSAQVLASTTFQGPTDGNYEIVDTIPFTSTIWSPCGAALPLNVNSVVRLTSPKDVNTGVQNSGMLTQDSVDGKISYIVGVQWQKCKN